MSTIYLEEIEDFTRYEDKPAINLSEICNFLKAARDY